MNRALTRLTVNSMPKYYAVAKGREGPKVYNSWDECKDNVSRFPGAVHKSFTSMAQAQTWLSSSLSLQTAGPSQAAPHSTGSIRSRKPYSRPEPIVPTQAPAQSSSSSNTEAAISGANVVLSPEQQDVLRRVGQGQSIFFSGSAGTGKSVLLREIIRQLGGHGDPTVGITASTGIAAVNIGGTTLHSWAGIGIGNEPAKKMTGMFIGQHERFVKVLERWRTVRTLIIDEISMVDGALFDKLEEMARILRRNEAPFGGIQLVLSGDFFQLPPVPNRVGDMIITPIFAFDSKTWESCIGHPVILTQVFRQKDQGFVELLNAMRFGKIENVGAFTALAREVKYTDGIEPTELLSTRAEVDTSNNSRLAKLEGDCQTYQAMQYAGTNSKGERVGPEQMERLLERLVVPKIIRLKVGAQVMLVKNLVQGHLVNGSVGQVIGFFSSLEAIQKHFEIGKLEGTVQPNAQQPDKNPDQLWPYVKFTDGTQVLLVPQEFTINNADGGMEARREQVPLILAWALSVHKSQGQTIERVKVDLRRTFEKGQAYVAVSRATTMEHLQILNFHPSKVVAHPRVLQWHAASQSRDRYQDMEDEMDSEAAMGAYYDN